VVLRLTIVLTLCISALAQNQNPWPCQQDINKSDPSALFIRVSDGVTNKLADTKVLPDVSDLKGKELDSVVVVQILVGTDGSVRCFRIQEGDGSLSQRSLDAARKWHYKPYILNGQPVNVETRIRFKYAGDKVEVVVPPR
jgi:bla regulator protein blaR1